MIGYIYKTTNLITGKFYIGKRQKSTFDKYYYGSGKYISASIAKYGKENFTREILEWCETVDELNEKERYWIKFLDARNLEIGYNIAEGGDGSAEGGKQNGLFCYVHDENGFIRVLKTDRDIYLNEGYLPGRGYGTNGLLGSCKSQEVKDKISKSNIGKHNHDGENNPCYGVTYKWITDGVSNKRVPIDSDIPDGWRRGKVQKPITRTEKFENYMNILRTDGHWKGDNNPSKKNSSYWFTDGEINVRRAECPEGFYPGISLKKKWYNNGKEEIFVKLNEKVPKGYVEGRLKHERKTD